MKTKKHFSALEIINGPNTKYQIQIIPFSLNYSNYWNDSNYLLQFWFDWIGGFDPKGGCDLEMGTKKTFLIN